MSWSNRVDELDVSLINHIEAAGVSLEDLRSLLALHAALATRGDFSCLEVGASHGASLQALIADPRCRRIVSIDRREESSSAEGSAVADRLLERLSKVPGADCGKLNAVEASTEDLDPAELSPDLCLIHAHHGDVAALRDARFCRQVLGGRGVIVFHDRMLVAAAIRRFLGELRRYRAYPLAHDMFVVEINMPSLLSDPRVSAQVPRKAWLVAERLRAIELGLRLSSTVWSLRRVFGQIALAIGAPRRGRRRARPSTAARESLFEIHTFVTDDALYEQMRQSFIDAGFDPDAFIRLTDADDDPYAAVTRIGRESSARYPILCHQDVFADQGPGAAQLRAVLEQLDAHDPYWVASGNAGVMRSGRVAARLDSGGAGESLPLPVVTLDANFIVLNARNAPRCSAGVSAFHLYGADVCLNALASGGSAYVIDFPVRHLGRGNLASAAYKHARLAFIETWSRRCWFTYVITTVETFFMSRSTILQRLFGSSRALACVEHAASLHRGSPLGE